MAQRIGELLISEGRLSEPILARALEVQSGTAKGIRLGGILLKWGLLAEEELLAALSKVHRCPPVPWSSLVAAKKEAVLLLSPMQASRLGAMPYDADAKSVRVAFVNPSDLAAIDEVKAVAAKRVIPAVATEVRLLQAQHRFYGLPLTRDVWSIVHRLEESPKTRSAESPAEPKETPALFSPSENNGLPPPPDFFTEVPTLSAPSVEPAEETEAVEDLESKTTEPRDDPNDTLGVATTGRSADLHGSALDPFSDKIPLTKFVEDALSYYGGKPSFPSALATFEEEWEKDLNSSLEDKKPNRFAKVEPRAGSRDLDETRPSRPRTR